MAPTTSRKTLAPPGRRNIQIRLNDEEGVTFDVNLAKAREAAGVKIKPGEYAKSATLRHGKLRELLGRVRASLHHKVPAATIAKMIDDGLAEVSS